MIYNTFDTILREENHATRQKFIILRRYFTNTTLEELRTHNIYNYIDIAESDLKILMAIFITSYVYNYLNREVPPSAKKRKRTNT